MKYEIEIDDPIYYLIKGNKKYYLNAQTYYQGVHYSIRSWIKHQVDFYLRAHFKNMPRYKKISLTIEFYSKKTNWDLDNKGYFWLKAIGDFIKDKIVEDDNVKYIDEMRLVYIQSDFEKLKIIINEKE